MRVIDDIDRPPRKPKVDTIVMRYLKRTPDGGWVEITNNKVR